jgi:hypothetical protein
MRWHRLSNGKILFNLTRALPSRLVAHVFESRHAKPEAHSQTCMVNIYCREHDRSEVERNASSVWMMGRRMGASMGLYGFP